jgi:preprotein translocase subunit SecA
MGQIYNFLGMQVGVLQMAAVTENGKKAFLVDSRKRIAARRPAPVAHG